MTIPDYTSMMTAMLVLLLVSCQDAPQTTDTNMPAAAVSCDPVDFEVLGHWFEPELPSRASNDHTDPGLAIGDLDADGWLDVLVAYAGGAYVLMNDGTGGLIFDDTWTSNGEPLPPLSSAALVDLDGDGDLDAFFGQEWGGLDLIAIQEEPGRFTHTELIGSEGAAETGAFADADGDGDLDLLIAQMGSDRHPKEIIAGKQVGEPNLLYIQDSLGSFQLENDRLPEADNFGLTFEGAWLDADGDGDLDIYEGNAWGSVVVENRLLLNDGTGHFTVAEDCGCELKMNSMGVAVGDANGDGFPDLHITDIGTPRLLLNLGDGTFYDGTFKMSADIPPDGINLSSWGTVFVDLSGNRCMDLLISFGGLGSEADNSLGFITPKGETWVDPEQQPDVMLLSDCTGFSRQESTLDAYPENKNRSVVVGDLDRDGRPDLVVAGKHYVRAWRTTGGCDDRLTVRLSGPQGNREGIGARVTATVDGHQQTTQWMLPSATHSASATELYFGSGGALTFTRLEVVWPDGSTTTQEDLEAGSTVEVVWP
ncbi:MAG: hypothetical protein ACI8RZ_003530 [Myxococcota bacterium]